MSILNLSHCGVGSEPIILRPYSGRIWIAWQSQSLFPIMDLPAVLLQETRTRYARAAKQTVHGAPIAECCSTAAFFNYQYIPTVPLIGPVIGPPDPFRSPLRRDASAPSRSTGDLAVAQCSRGYQCIVTCMFWRFCVCLLFSPNACGPKLSRNRHTMASGNTKNASQNLGLASRFGERVISSTLSAESFCRRLM